MPKKLSENIRQLENFLGSADKNQICYVCNRSNESHEKHGGRNFTFFFVSLKFFYNFCSANVAKKVATFCNFRPATPITALFSVATVKRDKNSRTYKGKKCTHILIRRLFPLDAIF